MMTDASVVDPVAYQSLLEKVLFRRRSTLGGPVVSDAAKGAPLSTSAPPKSDVEAPRQPTPFSPSVEPALFLPDTGSLLLDRPSVSGTSPPASPPASDHALGGDTPTPRSANDGGDDERDSFSPSGSAPSRHVSAGPPISSLDPAEPSQGQNGGSVPLPGRSVRIHSADAAEARDRSGSGGFSHGTPRARARSIRSSADASVPPGGGASDD